MKPILKQIPGIVFLLLLAAVYVGQSPTRDYQYNCAPLDGGPPITTSVSGFPVGNGIITVQIKSILSGDTTPPALTQIVVSAGASVLTGNVKIQAATNGVPFTITGIDDVGIRDASLYVDDVLVTTTSAGNDVLPEPFYLRWNTRGVAVGPHTFKLIVWDAALNSTSKTWVMWR